MASSSCSKIKVWELWGIKHSLKYFRDKSLVATFSSVLLELLKLWGAYFDTAFPKIRGKARATFHLVNDFWSCIPVHSCTNQEHCSASNIHRPSGEIQDNVQQTATHTLQHWKLWWWKSRCTAAFFHFTLDSQVSIWYFFPAATDASPVPGQKKCPAFFCVCVTSLLCRWGSAETSHAVWIASGVLCWEKRERMCIHWNYIIPKSCIPKSKSERQMHKREKAGLLQACSGEDYSASQLLCPLCGVIPTSAMHYSCFPLCCAEYSGQQRSSIF